MPVMTGPYLLTSLSLIEEKRGFLGRYEKAMEKEPQGHIYSVFMIYSQSLEDKDLF